MPCVLHTVAGDELVHSALARIRSRYRSSLQWPPPLILQGAADRAGSAPASSNHRNTLFLSYVRKRTVRERALVHDLILPTVAAAKRVQWHEDKNSSNASA
jgi:hypothetical protein